MKKWFMIGVSGFALLAVAGGIAFYSAAATLAVTVAVALWPKPERQRTDETPSNPNTERTAAPSIDRWADAVGPELEEIGSALERLHAELKLDTNPETDTLTQRS